MKSLSSVGLGLSIIFGCLLLALVAEVYYLLWWKKRITNREIENNYGNPVKELFYMFCWKRPSSSSLRQTSFTPPELCSSMRIGDTLVHNPEQVQSQSGKDFVFKPFGEDGMDAEYMSQQDLLGPPRFLFTIVEESKEDLESDDGKFKCDKSGKGSRGRSLGDLLVVETPYMTPTTSPPFFTPPFTTPISPYNQRGFNPLFETATDAEFNRLKSSPPPKFKFLQEAEEKLRRKLQQDENKGNGDEVDGSFITIVVDKKTEREVNHQPRPPQYHSGTSQVLPLAS
ncbi:hypothetical protein AAZX31_18G270600 [Glycine max]|uniref:Uncharacterized protein n=3 Tax=Glycine subgen. Soja TaxID=1462606 RepID=K7MVD0_SOYBN|nr:uncharacterized protein LOC102662096 [Glycine max]XP_014626790.1 uncharacterized protein LOC102662096 [Glycine max]XP_028212792.1 uncharacterized protein LOC114395262 [Glycine soja]XP_028212793.1 uncharacterized protein LOC114395262 [Glycine soja]XP_028212794.1 uncharacterized protein LOC114395262 [Glycine soja]XP_040868167.1 uncharacterized protein LOC102662096 [Glycine max]KAG4922918.1 hypothetical protein JHK86_051731 [Glycine max]KAG4937666.1 hypothetical protein JHK85_052585 [Glycine|eukprot:XP_014626789.1 uncharacterized protein LOC102662096 [Glycine max]